MIAGLAMAGKNHTHCSVVGESEKRTSPTPTWQSGNIWSSSENGFLDQQREMLAQGKQQKTPEYFVYFKFYAVQAWGSRAADWAKSDF